MADYVFRKKAKEAGLSVNSSSAGISGYPGAAASFETLQLLKGEELDATDHQGRRITELMLEEADLVCVMTQNHRRSLVELYPHAASKIELLTTFYEGEEKNILKEGIPDPIGMGETFFERVFDAILKSVDGLIEAIQSKKPS